MTTSGVGQPVEPLDYDSLSMDELARLQGVGPVASVDDMARDVFESDEELDEFLAHVAAWRRADLA